MSFDNFPKDILWLLMVKYFDPRDAVRCLSVCKRFYQCVDNDFVRRRVIKAHVAKEWAGNYSLTTCELCNCVLKKENMSTHLKKHEQYNHDTHRYRVEPPRKKQCELCDLPFPPKGHIGPNVSGVCPLEVVECNQPKLIYGIKNMCRFTGYRYQVQRHVCDYYCTICHDLFRGRFIDLHNHNMIHRAAQENFWRRITTATEIAVGICIGVFCFKIIRAYLF
jgi:hypothetical protein